MEKAEAVTPTSGSPGGDRSSEQDSYEATQRLLPPCESLGMSGAKLTGLGIFTHLRGLTELRLQRNDITSLHGLSRLRNLVNLNLSENRLCELGLGLKSLASLQHLDLSKNRIKNLGPLAGLRQLRSLVLTHNEIQELGGLTDLPSLVTLHLEENWIRRIGGLGDLGALRSLCLDKNAVSSLDNLGALSRLALLSLNCNCIEHLDGLGGLSMLADLRIAENSLDVIEAEAFNGLGYLESLDLSSNRLSAVPALPLPRLHRLDVSKNRLLKWEELATSLGQMAGLRTLHLHGNPLVDSPDGLSRDEFRVHVAARLPRLALLDDDVLC